MTEAIFLEDTAMYQEHYSYEDVPMPYLAVIEPSSLCNLECAMCPRTLGKSPSGTEKYGNMSLALLDRLESLFPHLNQAVLAWIGEPFIHKELGMIIRRLKHYHLHVHVTTNGMLLDKERAAMIIDAGLDTLAISIDAADPEIYKQIRRGGDLERVKGNIRQLNQMKRNRGITHPQLQITFVAMRENIAQMPAMVDFINALDVKQFTIGALDDFTLSDSYQLSDGKVLGEMAQARQSFEETQQRAQKFGISIGIESPVRFYHEIGEPPPEYVVEEKYFKMNYTPEQTAHLGLRKGCGVPWAHTVISREGNVHPCCISQTVMGNVFEQSFEEIWHGDKFNAFRRQLKSSNPPPECWHCRRTIWNGSHNLADITDVMLVGAQEIHGLGWGRAIPDWRGRLYREMEPEATLFLKNTRRLMLSLELGILTLPRVTGRVMVNGRTLGSFRLWPGWQRLNYALPVFTEDILKVKIITEPHVRHVVVRQVELQDKSFVNQPVTSQFRNWMSLGGQYIHKLIRG